MSDRLFTTDESNDKIYELDLDTLLDLTGGGVVAPFEDPRGIGGDETRLWTATSSNNKILEIDPDTLLDLSGGGASLPNNDVTGVGATYDMLAICENTGNKFYEFDKDTLLNLSGSGVTSVSTQPRGVGFVGNQMYHVDADNSSNQKMYKMSRAFVNQSGDGVTTSTNNQQIVEDVGGTSTRLYSSLGGGISKTLEYDPGTMLDISGGGVTHPGPAARGMGGMKAALADGKKGNTVRAYWFLQ